MTTSPKRPTGGPAVIARRAGRLWLVAAVLAALLAGLLSRHSPTEVVGPPLAEPSPQLPLGADPLGRDFLVRVLYGARASLGLTGLSIVLTVGLGSLFGYTAAAIGGPLERSLMWLANVLLAMPGLLLAMLLVATLGPSLAAVVLAVGIGGVPGFARLVRSLTVQLLGQSYVVAARAAGGGAVWIGVRHILPNALPQLAAFAGTYLAWAFIGATTLTFLGLAGDPSLPEWGSMLNASRSFLNRAPRLAIVPAACISLTILSIHSLLRVEPAVGSAGTPEITPAEASPPSPAAPGS